MDKQAQTKQREATLQNWQLAPATPQPAMLRRIPPRVDSDALEFEIRAELFALLRNSVNDLKIARRVGNVYEIAFATRPLPRNAAIDPVLPLALRLSMKKAERESYRINFSHVVKSIEEGVQFDFVGGQLYKIAQRLDTCSKIVGRYLTDYEKEFYDRLAQEAFLLPDKHAVGL